MQYQNPRFLLYRPIKSLGIIRTETPSEKVATREEATLKEELASLRDWAENEARMDSTLENADNSDQQVSQKHTGENNSPNPPSSGPVNAGDGGFPAGPSDMEIDYCECRPDDATLSPCDSVIEKGVQMCSTCEKKMI